MSVNWTPQQQPVHECPHADRERDNWLLTDGTLWLLCDDAAIACDCSTVPQLHAVAACRAQCERELGTTNRAAQATQLREWQGRHEVN